MRLLVLLLIRRGACLYDMCRGDCGYMGVEIRYMERVNHENRGFEARYSRTIPHVDILN